MPNVLNRLRALTLHWWLGQCIFKLQRTEVMYSTHWAVQTETVGVNVALCSAKCWVLGSPDSSRRLKLNPKQVSIALNFPCPQSLVDIFLGLTGGNVQILPHLCTVWQEVLLIIQNILFTIILLQLTVHVPTFKLRLLSVLVSFLSKSYILITLQAILHLCHYLPLFKSQIHIHPIAN